MNFLSTFSAILGLITAASLQSKTVIRQLDDAELIVAPKLRFDGDQSALKAVKTGEKVELRCEAFGLPAPVVYWTRNGELLSAGDEAPDSNLLEKFRNMGIRTYQIGNTVAIHQIPCATAKDNGIYTCVADNGHQTLKRDVELIAEGEDYTCSDKAGISPFIIMWSDLRMDRESADVQIYCRALGKPKPTIKWYNAEGVQIKDGVDYETLSNGDLLVKNIRFFVNDGGFNCSASNEFGEDLKESFLYAMKYDGEDDKKAQ